jgi:two-component system, OmpR family, aerobic respiration control sensor histidine kinase ArcB
MAEKDEDYWLGQEFILDILNQLPSRIFWKNTDCVFLGCNRAFLQGWNLSTTQDIIGKTDYDLPPTKEENDAYRADDMEVMATGKAKLNIEESQTHEDGTETTILTSKVPLFNKQGKIVGLLGIFNDITELKKTQRELLLAKEAAEAANHAKTDFIQNMQHDIRTPAAGVWSLLNELTKQELDPKKRNILSMLTGSSLKLLDLCNAVVDFSYIDQDKRPVLEEKIDIREIASGVLDLNKPAAFGKDLALHLKIDGNVPSMVMTDEFRIRRILVNLIGNAVKFTHQGSVTLHISAKLKDERYLFLQFNVKDTGIGIPESKRNMIFEKFSRGIQSDMGQYEGTGLGLYLVKKFVHELEGDLELDSTVGTGTKFTVIFPCKIPLMDMNVCGTEINETYTSPLKEKAPLDVSLPFIAKQSTHVLFSHRVLLVEDDPVCLFAATEVLAHFTHMLDVVRDVEEACSQLQKHLYDFVIADLGLPDGTGIDILKFARNSPENKNYETPFIALTAHKDMSRHKSALAAGFNEITIKPLLEERALSFFEVYELRTMIEKVADADSLCSSGKPA